MSLFANVPCWIRKIPEHLKMREMCDEAVDTEPYSFAYVPNPFKTEGMYFKTDRRQCAENHTPCGMFMIISLHRKYVTR